jgi:hypothetical protein
VIKIGYLGNEGGDLLGLENLVECKPTPIKLLGGALTRCPSVRGYHMNTFEVKCPFDLEWTITRDSGEGELFADNWHWEINPDNTTIDCDKGLEILSVDSEGKSVQVMIHPGWSFVSDTPNTIMLQHTNGIDTNPQMISGQLDIYKWPDRQMSIGYYVQPGKQTFTLKKGQPWYRVTFFTPGLDTVKLVEMTERSEFLKRTANKSYLSNIKYLNWRKVFTDFGNSRPKKLIR